MAVTSTSLAVAAWFAVVAVTVPVVSAPMVPAVAVVAMPSRMSIPVALVMSVPVPSVVSSPVLPVAVVVPLRTVTVVCIRQGYVGGRQPGFVAFVRGRDEGNRETDNCDRHADQSCAGFDHLCLRVPIGQDQRYSRAIERRLN